MKNKLQEFDYNEFVIEETELVNKISLRSLNLIYSPREGWCMEVDKQSGLTLFYR